MSAYEKKITQCEQLLRYDFKNKLFCLEALQTSGNPLIWENGYRIIRKNENLAVLGDVVMKAHLCKRWYSTGRVKGRISGNRPGFQSNHSRAMGCGRTGHHYQQESLERRVHDWYRDLCDPKPRNCHCLQQNHGNDYRGIDRRRFL